MSTTEERLYKDLSDAVLNMDEGRTVIVAKEVVTKQLDVYQAIERGLSEGMNRAGRLYEEEEYFIPELLLCSDAMYAGLDVLKGHLKADLEGAKEKVVIGVVEGDTHDIGKNLVKIMLATSGFEVIDLGRDVPPRAFVDKAAEAGARIIALSTLMTATMKGMKEVILLLKQGNIRDRVRVMVGGGPISKDFAKRIGADGYAVNASQAVKLARQLAGGLTDG